MPSALSAAAKREAFAQTHGASAERMLDAAISELIMLRMVSRLGHAPPVYSLGGTSYCPVSGGPLRCSRAGIPHPTADREAEARRWEACRSES